MKKLKILALFLIIICMLFSVTGCEKYINENKIAKQDCDKIIQCFNNEDLEGLKSMFCKKIADTHDLDTEIQEAFDFLDGEVTSYKNRIGGGGKDVDEGKTTRLDIDPVIDKMVTDTGNKYRISFNAYLICEKDTDLVGITYINLFDENGEKYTIGDLYISIF